MLNFRQKIILILLSVCAVYFPAHSDELKPAENVIPSPQDVKKPENEKGHILYSLAAVYSPNIHGVIRPDKAGQIFPLALLVEIGANDNIGFETGLIFNERQYLVESDNYNLQQNVKRVHIPVTVKIWWRDTVAISAGPYVSVAASGIESQKWIRVSDTNNLKTPADDTFEFGFESALTFNFPLSDKTGLFVEGRYYAPYGEVQLKKYNSVYGLIGIKIQWQ